MRKFTHSIKNLIIYTDRSDIDKVWLIYNNNWNYLIDRYKLRGFISFRNATWLRLCEKFWQRTVNLFWNVKTVHNKFQDKLVVN